MKPSNHHTSSEQIPLTAFIVEDRLRDDDETVRQAIELSLAPSIAQHGLIHPILLNRVKKTKGKNLLGDEIESDLILIAGWSRCQAFLLLNHTSIPYTTRDKLSKADALMLEVEENTRRTRMKWTSRVLAIKRVHDLQESEKAKKFEAWGHRATGELLGVNRATVTQALMVGKLIESGDTEIITAASFDAAKQICLKRKEQEIERIRAARTVATSVASATTHTTASARTPPKISGLIPNTNSEPVVLQEQTLVDSKVIDLSSMIFNDACVYPNNTQPGWMTRQAAESFDLVFTDIPFGIEMGNLDIVDLGDVEAEHDVQENVDQMLPFLSESYRLLKDKSYCIFFMDLKHWEKLADWGSQVGFKVMPYPIIWHKLSTVKNRAASKWWPKKIEYLMVMAKGSATLKEAQKDLVIAASGDVERKKYGHPFAKPFEVIKQVLDPVVQPGYKVLDPYAGSGSMVCSMISMGLKPVAIEKKEEHFTRLKLNVMETYTRILGDKKPTFV